MWFLAILGVWIGSRGDGDPQTPHGCRLLCNIFDLDLPNHFCWPVLDNPDPHRGVLAASWELASSWHLSQPCSRDSNASPTIPTSPHCCSGPITLLMDMHVCTAGCTTFGISQLCSSCHLCKSLCGRSSSFHGETEGQTVAKPKSQQCL